MKHTLKKLAPVIFVAFAVLLGNNNTQGSETPASNSKSESSFLKEAIMTGYTRWDINNEFDVEMDSKMELENWMTNDINWMFTLVTEIDEEANLEIESWMTSEKVWNGFKNNAEKGLALESWMTDSKVWK